MRESALRHQQPRGYQRGVQPRPEELTSPPHSKVVAVSIERPLTAHEFDEADFRKMFQHFGEILDIRFSRSGEEALVHFVSSKDAAKSLMLDGLHLPDWGVLTVREHSSESESDFQNWESQQVLRPEPSNSSYRHRTNSPYRHIGDSSPSPQSTRAQSPYRRGSGGRQASSNPSTPLLRLCREELIDLFELEPEFNVAAHICGGNNRNPLYILEQCNDRINLKIQGTAGNDIPVADRLHLSISSRDEELYRRGVGMSEDLLLTVCQEYADFCHSRGHRVPETMGFRRHEYSGTSEDDLEYIGCYDLRNVPAFMQSRQSGGSSGGRGSKR